MKTKENFLNKTNIFVVVFILFFVSLFGSNAAYAQEELRQPKMPQLKYTEAELSAAGCSSTVWQMLLKKQEEAVTLKNNLQHEILVADEADLANVMPSGSKSCFDQAAAKLDKLGKQIDQLLSLMSKLGGNFSVGEIDFSRLTDQITNALLSAACKELDKYTGSLTKGLGGIRGTAATPDSIMPSIGLGKTIFLNDNPMISQPLVVPIKVPAKTEESWLDKINPFK